MNRFKPSVPSSDDRLRDLINLYRKGVILLNKTEPEIYAMVSTRYPGFTEQTSVELFGDVYAQRENAARRGPFPLAQLKLRVRTEGLRIELTKAVNSVVKTNAVDIRAWAVVVGQAGSSDGSDVLAVVQALNAEGVNTNAIVAAARIVYPVEFP